MQVVKYILESEYENGDMYADKFDSPDEVVDMLCFINSDENNGSVAENRIRFDKIRLYTEVQE